MMTWGRESDVVTLNSKLRDVRTHSLVEVIGTAWYFLPMTSRFRSTLWRVLGIQAIALALLWLLQSRYAA